MTETLKLMNFSISSQGMIEFTDDIYALSLALWVKFPADDILKCFPYFFPRKQDLTFHANCLQFSGKISPNLSSGEAKKG